MTINDSIGIRIKNLRIEKHMTLKDLSGLTNLSIGFLSQIENGKTSVAIDTLSKIANVLDVSLPYLLSQNNETHSNIVMRSYDIPYHQKNMYCIEGSLTSNEELSKIQPTLLTLLPHTSSIPKPSEHSGEEFLYVIDGVITLELAHTQETLYPGDSAHFKSTVSHVFWNNSNHIAHVFSAHLRTPEQSSDQINYLEKENNT